MNPKAEWSSSSSSSSSSYSYSYSDWSRSRIREALEDAAARLSAAGIERPAMEAQILLAHALAISRLDVVALPDRELDEREMRALQRLTARRCRREPLAYIRGVQEVYGLELGVNPAT